MRPWRIITVTPNPALDLSGRVSVITPNEKNYVTGELLGPGGNGLNVSRIAHRLRVSTLALGFIGGSNGKEITRLLDREGIAHSFTKVHGNTRMNVTVMNERDHQQTRLAFPGKKVTKLNIFALLRKLESVGRSGLVMAGGSLPEGCPEDFYVVLAKVASKLGVPFLLDAPAKYLSHCLASRKSKLFFIKPNLVEFEELTGNKFKSEAKIAQTAMDLAAKATFICVSLGENGAILATERGAWLGRAPRVRARGTVGAGDSMVGAIAAKFAHYKINLSNLSGNSTNEVIEDIFSWGLAAGAASAEAEGTAMASLKRIQSLRRGVKVRLL